MPIGRLIRHVEPFFLVPRDRMHRPIDAPIPPFVGLLDGATSSAVVNSSVALVSRAQRIAAAVRRAGMTADPLVTLDMLRVAVTDAQDLEAQVVYVRQRLERTRDALSVEERRAW